MAAQEFGDFMDEILRTRFAHITMRPRRRASRRSSSSSCTLNTTIFIPGALCTIPGIASIPFITGIDISKMIRSGNKAFVIAMASDPFMASPHTSKPALSKRVSNRSLHPSWSSASRIRRGIELFVLTVTWGDDPEGPAG